MAHVSLYRRFRPSGFDKVIGQEHIVRTLINQIKTDSVSHAYLFTGTRGTGKTSCAKIFARAVNCLSPINGSPCEKCTACLELNKESNIDVIEIDAASNNGVDEIRELRDNIQYRPSIGKYKVYIIDEVHMLTVSAFNALLKTLEEPPSHIIFILATTEAHKLPATILSRCLRFDFRLVSRELLAGLVARIFTEINYKFQKKALDQIAIYAEGSVRDCLSIADMCMSYAPNGLNYEDVLEVLGASDNETLHTLATAIIDRDVSTIIKVSNVIASEGKGIATISRELASYFRDVLAIKNVEGYTASFADYEYPKAIELASKIDNYRLSRTIDILSSLDGILRYSTQPRIMFEASLIKASELITDFSVESIVSQIKTLQKTVDNIVCGDIALKSKTIDLNTPTTANNELPSDLIKMEDAPLEFEDSKEYDQEVLDFWQAVLMDIKEQKYQFVYFGLQAYDKIVDRDNAIILTTSDPATLALLNDPKYMEIIRNTVSKISNNTREFSFTDGRVLEQATAKDRATLAELFGNKLTIKDNKAKK